MEAISCPTTLPRDIEHIHKMFFRFLLTVVTTPLLKVALGHLSDVAQSFLLDLSNFALDKMEVLVFLANSVAL